MRASCASGWVRPASGWVRRASGWISLTQPACHADTGGCDRMASCRSSRSVGSPWSQQARDAGKERAARLARTRAFRPCPAGTSAEHSPGAQRLGQPAGQGQGGQVRRASPSVRRPRRRPRPASPRSPWPHSPGCQPPHRAAPGRSTDPTSAPHVTWSPVSSWVSRTTACSSLSPGSIRPPGSDHRPASGSCPRWISRRRPASSLMIAPTQGTRSAGTRPVFPARAAGQLAPGGGHHDWCPLVLDVSPAADQRHYS